MRGARRKLRGQAGYYHLYNRATGYTSLMPFGNAEKEHAFNLVIELSHYFMLDILSVCWLGNHFHLVVHAPAQPPDLATAARRHNAFYAKRGDNYSPVSHPKECQRIAERMIDISYFMSQLQQRVAVRRNQPGDWRGNLWTDRFKSSIIGGDRRKLGTVAAEDHQPQRPGGVWRCVKYIELNPCRAGLVSDPGAYRWSTWGRYCQTGTHPFGRHFVHHLKRCLGDPVAARWSAAELYAEFRGQLAAELTADAGGDETAQRAAKAEASGALQEPASALLELERRGRFWINGGIIGSAEFVQWVVQHLAAQAPPDTPASKRKPRAFSQLEDRDAPAPDDADLVSYHRPRGPRQPRQDIELA